MPFPGPFRALSFGAEKRVLKETESRQLRTGPTGEPRPAQTVAADDRALFHEAREGADLLTEPQLVQV